MKNCCSREISLALQKTAWVTKNCFVKRNESLRYQTLKQESVLDYSSAIPVGRSAARAD